MWCTFDRQLTDFYANETRAVFCSRSFKRLGTKSKITVAGNVTLFFQVIQLLESYGMHKLSRESLSFISVSFCTRPIILFQRFTSKTVELPRCFYGINRNVWFKRRGPSFTANSFSTISESFGKPFARTRSYHCPSSHLSRQRKPYFLFPNFSGNGAIFSGTDPNSLSASDSTLLHRSRFVKRRKKFGNWHPGVWPHAEKRPTDFALGLINFFIGSNPHMEAPAGN